MGFVTRRRDLLPPDIQAQVDDDVLLICTDRGQHNRCVLGSANSVDGHRPRTWLPVNRVRVQRAGAGVFQDQHGTIHLVCLRCDLHIRWQLRRAETIADAAVRAGLRELDVSHMAS